MAASPGPAVETPTETLLLPESRVGAAEAGGARLSGWKASMGVLPEGRATATLDTEGTLMGMALSKMCETQSNHFGAFCRSDETLNWADT